MKGGALWSLLLMSCGCLAIPLNAKVGRRFQDEEVATNMAVTNTREILTEVSSFLEKLSALTNENQNLTPQEAMTVLPEFVVEAVKLRGELDKNPVREEDAAAVERVKDLVASSLYAFAQRYDGQGAVQAVLPANAQEPDSPAEYAPEAVTEAVPDEPEPEVTTVLAPAEDPATTDNQQDEEEEEEEEEAETPPKKSSPPAVSWRQRTRIPPSIGNPFSNTAAFAFTNPISNHVQGPAPIIRMMPSGGYYVYYNQGR